jgi:hypothetical protein
MYWRSVGLARSDNIGAQQRAQGSVSLLTSLTFLMRQAAGDAARCELTTNCDHHLASH